MIDYGAVIASSGPPVALGPGVVVMANATIRSVGGEHRPAFPVEVGADSLIGPLAALTGCTVGEACYLATGVMVFHGATVGDGSRLGAGSIVHTGAQLPPGSRVGMDVPPADLLRLGRASAPVAANPGLDRGAVRVAFCSWSGGKESALALQLAV